MILKSIIKRHSVIVVIFIFLIDISWAQVPEVEQTIHPDNVQKAELWLSTHGYHAARQELEKLYPYLSSTEQKRDVLFVLLQCAFEDQEYENSYQWSDEFLTNYPNDGRKYTALFIYGVSEFQTGRTDEALKSLDKFIVEAGAHPAVGAAYFWRAMCKLDKGNWQSAEDDARYCYRDSVSQNYHDYALMGWALSLERRGEYYKAIELLEKFLKDYPQSSLISEVKIRLASLSLRIGFPSRSLNILNDVDPSYIQRQEYSLIQAEANLQLGNYSNSQKIFKNFVENYPASQYERIAQYGLGWSYMKQGNIFNAQKEFDSLGTGNDSLAFISLYQSAALALLHDRPIEALSRFDTLTERSPYDELAENSYFQSGMIYYRAKRYRDARRAFQLAARLFPEGKNRARSYRMLGETNLALSDFSNAQYAFARVRQLNGSPELVVASMYQEGVSLYHLGRFKSCTDLFKDFLKKYPKDEHTAEAYLWCGEALYQDGKYADAEQSYAVALHMLPENPKRIKAAYGLAWAYFEQKKFSHAAAAFDKFVTQYPSDEHVLEATLRQADCYSFLGDYDKANALYLSINDLKKNNQYAEYAAFQIAMSYIQRGESERGIEQLRNFLVRYPTSLYNEVVQFNIGWTYFSKNQFNEALGDFRKIPILYPGSQLMPRVLFNMGDAFYNLHQYDSARIYYQRVPKEYPTSQLVTDALQGLQYTYEAEGKPSGAIAQIDTLLKSSTIGISQEELYLKKGDILFGQADFGGAVIEYQKVLSLKPDRQTMAKAYYQLGRAFEMENNTQQSIKYYQRILSDFSDADFAPSVALALGIAQIKLKSMSAAADVLAQFEKKYPGSPLLSEAKYYYGVALLDQKDKKPALEQFQNIIKDYPVDIFSDRSRLQIAQIHIVKKEFKAALDTLTSIINRRNDDIAAEALLLIGDSYLSMKKYTDALQAYKDVFTQYTEYKLIVERAHFGAGKCYEMMRNPKFARNEYEGIINSPIDPAVKKDAQERLRKLRK